MQQMLSRFGEGSRQRIAVAQRLERIYRVAIATGQVARFVVFGSFVTAKSEPADVDVFVLMDNTFDIGRLTGETRVLFDHAALERIGRFRNRSPNYAAWNRTLITITARSPGFWQRSTVCNSKYEST